MVVTRGWFLFHFLDALFCCLICFFWAFSCCLLYFFEALFASFCEWVAPWEWEWA